MKLIKSLFILLMFFLIIQCSQKKPFIESGELPEGIKYVKKLFWEQRKHLKKLPLLSLEEKKLIKKLSSTHSEDKEVRVKVDSIPPSANVIIDGIKIGKTPVVLHGVKIGRHFIKVMLDTYKSSTKIVDLKPGKNIKIDFKMQKYLSVLYVNSSLKKAKVYLDKKFVGFTPLKLKNITMGMHELWLQKIVNGKKYYGYEEIWVNQENKAWNVKMRPYIIPRDFVKIPGGWFIMNLKPQQDGEGPARRVYVSSFYISKYETTNKNFKKVFQNHVISPYSARDMQPVTNVSWYQAYLYAKKMGYRLPTEAEWDKAARGGRNRRLAIKGGMRRYSPGVTVWMAHDNLTKQSVEVNKMSSNRYGIYNMSGNANEWVNDWYAGSYFRWGKNKNPKGPEFGAKKVMRGSSWLNWAFLANLSTRYRYLPDEKKHVGGFRCAINAWMN